MSQQHIGLEEDLGQAFDRGPVAMVVVNPQGAITRLNRLAETSFGYATVWSMVMIHRTLYQSHDFAQMDFHRFLGELLPVLMGSYGMVSGHVGMEIEAHDVKLPINEAIPCGHIVNEFVSNALKHGFTDQVRGAIRVTLACDASQHVELSIVNDSNPISPDESLHRKGSLGLQRVRPLTRQLHGRLDVQRAGPTHSTLRFPKSHAP